MENEKKQQEEERKRLNEERKQLEEEQRRLDEIRNHQDRAANPDRSNVARRKSLSRALQSLPKSATVFADTIEDVIEKASPRKQEKIKEKGLHSANREVDSVIGKSVGEQLKALGKSKKKNEVKKKHQLLNMMASGILKRYHLQRSACKKFKMSQ